MREIEAHLVFGRGLADAAALAKLLKRLGASMHFASWLLLLPRRQATRFNIILVQIHDTDIKTDPQHQYQHFSVSSKHSMDKKQVRYARHEHLSFAGASGAGRS